ncbi:MAG: hypothetical protein ACI90V_006168 [Bacillariaceae sp.]|jgi:hypothetical protein
MNKWQGQRNNTVGQQDILLTLLGVNIIMS